MTTVKLGSYFETKKRDNGETLVTVTEHRPQWLQDAIYDAHNGLFPDDWVYSVCYSACLAIDDGSLTVDNTHDFTDSEVDIYTRDLYRWAADMCHSDIYAEAEEEANGIMNDETDTVSRIRTIQYCAIDRIANIIVNAEENKEDSAE